MKYTVLTLFPEITNAFFDTSIMAKAIQRGIIEYRAINIRDYAFDRHKTCDDAPYGGGPGMLMLPEPLGRALEAAGAVKKGGGRLFADNNGVPRVMYLSPSGRPFDQHLARELAAEQELVLVCGRYEGIDQRIIDLYIDDEVSVGDYVLSSGEVAALAVIDATYRLVDQVITAESLHEESFSGGLLEYPQYTRPEVYDTIKVPEVLLSGHHERIRRWRLERRVEKTLRQRPDLIRRGKEYGYFNREIEKIIDSEVEGDKTTNERD
ncbi:MAG: tRNA (guanosine(37)-N1)-methyltransferase TrmD [Treponema sp.]|jgi:tRNA (guanine37-N1)-methyltransferase|nr:tRNA (guanosine(37)-N1)-methyltransferase TrmD [Treponema sp.]